MKTISTGCAWIALRKGRRKRTPDLQRSALRTEDYKDGAVAAEYSTMNLLGISLIMPGKSGGDLDLEQTRALSQPGQNGLLQEALRWDSLRYLNKAKKL